MKRTIAFLILVFSAGLGGSAWGESIFSSRHLGVPVSPSDARSRGMGGVSTAIPGENFSFTNPASTVNFWRSGFSGVLSQDYRTLKAPEGETLLRSTDFMAFRGVFPTYKRFVVSWGIYQWRDLGWDYNDEVESEFFDNKLGRTLSSDGGLYVSRVGIARQVNSHLALGLGIDWLIGRAKRHRIIDFATDGVLNSTEYFTSRYSFIRPTFGLLTNYKNIRLGLSLTLARTAEVERNSTFISGYREEKTMPMKYPLLWRVGGAYRLTRRSILGADFEVEKWGDDGIVFDHEVESTDQRRFCIGYELMPAAGENPPFYRKVPLRMGFSWTKYPYRVGGFDVSEKFISFGSGLFFGRRSGMVDMALEIGARSTDAPGYPDEKVIRVVFSLSAFEKWVPRPRRRK